MIYSLGKFLPGSKVYYVVLFIFVRLFKILKLPITDYKFKINNLYITKIETMLGIYYSFTDNTFYFISKRN